MKEGERQSKKHQTYLISKDKNSEVRMHEHVTCKFKCIIGSTQSKPTSTQHSNEVNTHLRCMKHCYNAYVMQCMKF